MLKKIILLGCFIFAITLVSRAQRFELTPFGGYTFADKIPIELGEATIKGGITYGGIFSFDFKKRNTFEIIFSRMDATATAYSDVPGFIDMTDQVDVNYILAGIKWRFPINKQALFFAGINLGPGIIASKDDKFTTMTKFAIGVDAGIKYSLSEKLGLRFQAFLNTPVTDEGETIWWSSGTGTTAGSTSYFPLTQFGLTAGLVFHI